MKTLSSAKKGRFRITKNGKVIATQANKRHNMRNKSKRQLSDQRGTTVLCHVEAQRVKSYFPYGTPK